MRLSFARSARSTVGVEWELALVEARTGRAAPRAPQVLAALRSSGQRPGPDVRPEFLLNTVEIVSGAHDRLGSAIGDLHRGLDALRAACEPQGLDVLAAGTHPSAVPAEQPVTPTARYDRLVERTRWWGRQMLIFGLHTHVGVEDRAKVLPLAHALEYHLPLLQALSASSPYWAGQDTGYATNRAMIFRQLPTAGLPPRLATWPALEEYTADMIRAGAVSDYSELRWDVRPAPRFGTVEARICDAPPTLTEVAALAALTLCVVEEASTDLDAGRDPRVLPPWFVAENKWRSARYGLEAEMILDARGHTQPLRRVTERTLDRLEPVAARLGCLAELRSAHRICDVGPSYARQRAVAEASGGDLGAVVRFLVEECRAGAPCPVAAAARGTRRE